MTEKYYVIELACYFLPSGGVTFTNVDSLEEGDAKQSVIDNLFAECNIPYHAPDGSVYCFTCHIFNKLNHEPAILEMVALQNMAPWLHEKFQSECKEVLYDASR